MRNGTRNGTFFLNQFFVADTKYNGLGDEFVKKCLALKENWLKQRKGTKEDVRSFHCVNEALEALPQNESLDVLVTGSLHLVGNVLGLLDPDLNNSNSLKLS